MNFLSKFSYRTDFTDTLFLFLIVVDVVAPVDSRSKQLESVSSCKRGGKRLQILCFFSGDTYRLVSERIGSNGRDQRLGLRRSASRSPLDFRPCREVLVELSNL